MEITKGQTRIVEMLQHLRNDDQIDLPAELLQQLKIGFEIQPVDTPELRQQALDRLSNLAVYVDTEIRNLSEGLEAGYSAPRLNVPAVIEESRALLAEGSPLLSPGSAPKIRLSPRG